MNYRPSPLADLPTVTKNLLIINTLLLLATWAAQNMFGVDLANYLGLHYPLSERFNPAQFGTYMFMHGGFSHLFFNMFTLFMFGRVLETYWGPKKFVVYYIATGLGAALIHLFVNFIEYKTLVSQMSQEQIALVFRQGAQALDGMKNFTDPLMAKLNLVLNIPTVGASGAIFGILMAFGMLFPNAQLMLLFPPIPIKGKYIAVLALVAGVLVDYRGNVAHFAHLGGMIFGYLLLKYWEKKGI